MLGWVGCFFPLITCHWTWASAARWGKSYHYLNSLSLKTSLGLNVEKLLPVTNLARVLGIAWLCFSPSRHTCTNTNTWLIAWVNTHTDSKQKVELTAGSEGNLWHPELKVKLTEASSHNASRLLSSALQDHNRGSPVSWRESTWWK